MGSTGLMGLTFPRSLLMSPHTRPNSLAQLTLAHFESDARAFIEQRLHHRGPSPYSICEACLGEADYLALQMWAQTVSLDRLTDALGNGGLVFLTLVSEYN